MQDIIIRDTFPENQSNEPNEPSFSRRCATVLWHAVALVIWVYIIVKLFVYDIDNFLIQTFFPTLSWLVEYKVFFIIGLVSMFLIIFNKSQILLWVLFTSLYPIIILVWYIPRVVFKTDNWMFLVALLNSLLSFFRSFRFNFVCVSTGLIAVAVIFNTHNETVLYISAGILGALLVILYFNSFAIAFKPFSVIKIYEKFFGETAPEFVTKQHLDKSIKALTIIEMMIRN